MALTVSEAAAVFDLLHWIGCHPLGEKLVDDDRAGAALALLGDHAGKTLQISVRPGEAREALERHAARLAAADAAVPPSAAADIPGQLSLTEDHHQ